MLPGLKNHLVFLKDQERPIHTASYLPKQTWHLINTCSPSTGHVSRWDIKSKPLIPRCKNVKGKGRVFFKSKPQKNCAVIPQHVHSIAPVICCWSLMSLWIARRLISQPILLEWLCPLQLDDTVYEQNWKRLSHRIWFALSYSCSMGSVPVPNSALNNIWTINAPWNTCRSPVMTLIHLTHHPFSGSPPSLCLVSLANTSSSKSPTLSSDVLTSHT